MTTLARKDAFADVLNQFAKRIYNLEQRGSNPLHFYTDEYEAIWIGPEGNREKVSLFVDPPTNMTLTTGTFFDLVFVDVAWDMPASPETVAFEVQFAEKIDATDYGIPDFRMTSGNSVRVSGLKPETTYGFFVVGVNRIGVRSTSPGYTDITTGKDTTIPDAPTGLVVSKGVNLVMAWWDEHTAPDVALGRGQYEAELSTEDGGVYTPVRNIVTSARVASFNDLAHEVTYHVRIRAIDSSGNVGVWSTYVEAVNDGKVTGEIIAAGTIIGSHILAGSITAADAIFDTAAIQSADIAELAADKILAGSLAVGRHISSTNFQTGVSGWIIRADGSAEFQGVTVRGTFTTRATENDTGVTIGVFDGTNGAIRIYRGATLTGQIIGLIDTPTGDTIMSMWGGNTDTGIDIFRNTNRVRVKATTVDFSTNVDVSNGNIDVKRLFATGTGRSDFLAGVQAYTDIKVGFDVVVLRESDRSTFEGGQGNFAAWQECGVEIRNGGTPFLTLHRPGAFAGMIGMPESGAIQVRDTVGYCGFHARGYASRSAGGTVSGDGYYTKYPISAAHRLVHNATYDGPHLIGAWGTAVVGISSDNAMILQAGALAGFHFRNAADSGYRNIHCWNLFNYGGACDVSVKEDIRPVSLDSRAIDKIRGLEFHDWRFKSSFHDDDRRHISPMAHDMPPELIRMTPRRVGPDLSDGHIAVADSIEVQWFMMRALKELAQEVDALKS